MLRTLLLAPVLAAQALWVIARATRLPEAAGPRRGQSGKGPLLRVLVVGDSSAAGVGVDDQQDALAGQLAATLGDQFTVEWQVIAKSGGTAASTCRLVTATPPAPFDIAVTALGVNDTKNGVGFAKWQSGYKQLIALLRQTSPEARIYVSGLPPLGDFPLLPKPLSTVLGTRAARFDTVPQALADADTRIRHVRYDLPLQPHKMARDGFHPGAEVYTYWAEQIATQIHADLA